MGVALPAALALLLAATGDPGRGEAVFQRCYACHSVEPGETGLTGPNLRGILGRAAATEPGFAYSEAMRAAARASLVWDARTLDAFIADPQAVVPGNGMGFFGLPDARDRADLIAFLARSSLP